jgi:hypothetical protein
MDNKTVVIGALVVGAILVVLLARGGSGGSASLTALPPVDSSGDRAGAFSGLVDLGRAEFDYNRDLTLGRINAAVESQRIDAAYRASLDQDRVQLEAARAQASAQSRGDFLGFLSSAAQTVFSYLAVA